MRQLRQRGPYIYFMVLLPCAIYTVFYTARAIWLDYTAVPYWDSWRFVQYLDQLRRFDIRHFWLQHNEHRILFPEIVFALDYMCFRGLQLLPIACNVACLGVQLGLLWWLLKQMAAIPVPFRLAFGACGGLFMASAIQVQVILNPFMLQWYLGQTAAALAFLFLWQSARIGGSTYLALTMTAAVVATYSTVNGMMLWPLLVIAAVLLSLPSRHIAAVGVAGVLSIAVYFAGYSLSPGRMHFLLRHPFYALWFMGVFLGTPVSYLNTAMGFLTGLSGLALVLVAAAIAIRRRRFADPVLGLTTGICLYIACSALVIAYFHMEPGDAAANAAKAQRDACVPLTYWANLVIVIAWLAHEAGARVSLEWVRLLALHLAAIGLTIVVLGAVIRRQESYERVFAAQQARRQAAGVALLAGVEDSDVIRLIYPDPAFVEAVTPALRRARLSIFASGRQDWIGRPLSKLFQVGSLDLCSGSVDELSAVDGGYHVEGWALDTATRRPPRDIVITNASGTIAGLAETRSGGYPHSKLDHSRRPPSDLDWVGYARAERVPGTVIAYAILSGGKIACALGPASFHVEPIDASQVGAAIHIAEWKADPAWTRDGFHSSVGTLTGQILYGSYSGSDTNQGVLISAPFETNEQDCLALPVAHGPSTAGQSVRLEDAESGKVVAVIPLDAASGAWQYWSIDIQGAPRLRIVAEDKGGKWGQWVAVGEPHRCQP